MAEARPRPGHVHTPLRAPAVAEPALVHIWETRRTYSGSFRVGDIFVFVSEKQMLATDDKTGEPSGHVVVSSCTFLNHTCT